MNSVNIKQQVLVCTVGTILEWYDFSLFAALAAIMAPLFFPATHFTTALMATFAIFATGFIMRPLGAILFGHMGDRIGRKSTLALTIIIMAIATTAIGLIPLNNQHYLLAPTLLVILRLLQGLACSGELPGGLAWLAELAPPQKRGFISSFGIFAAALGLMLGSLVGAITAMLLTDQALLSWGWRVPFLLSAPLGIVGLILRYKLAESDIFTQAAATNALVKIPAIEVLRYYSKSLLATGVLFMLSNVAIYINLVYLTSYLANIHVYSHGMALIVNAVITSVYAICALLFGYLSDQVGRSRLLLLAVFSFVIFSYPFFILIFSGTPAHALIGQMLIAMITGLLSGSTAAAIAEFFPTRVRYSGIALGINIPAALFGGTAPFVASTLTTLMDSAMAPAYYLILLSLVALFILIRVTKDLATAVTENYHLCHNHIF